MPNLKSIGPRITKILGRGPTNPPLEGICLAKRLEACRVKTKCAVDDLLMQGSSKKN